MRHHAPISPNRLLHSSAITLAAAIALGTFFFSTLAHNAAILHHRPIVLQYHENHTTLDLTVDPTSWNRLSPSDHRTWEQAVFERNPNARTLNVHLEHHTLLVFREEHHD